MENVDTSRKSNKVGTVVGAAMEKTVTVKVEITECRPLSRRKRWRVSSIIERAK